MNSEVKLKPNEVKFKPNDLIMDFKIREIPYCYVLMTAFGIIRAATQGLDSTCDDNKTAINHALKMIGSVAYRLGYGQDNEATD